MGLAALNSGAKSVKFVESDMDMCKMIEKNVSKAIGKSWSDICTIEEMRVQALDEKERYDVVICDPPDITSHTIKKQDTRTKPNDKRINFYQHALSISLKRCKYGGHIFFFLNTKNISRSMALRVIQSTAGKTNSTLQVVRHLSSSPDFPEHSRTEGDAYFGIVLQKLPAI